MNAALHHIPAPENVLREIDRVLKPGGRFCLGHEPNAAFFNFARRVARRTTDLARLLVPVARAATFRASFGVCGSRRLKITITNTSS